MDKRRVGLFGSPLAAPRYIESGEQINGSRRVSLDFFSSIYRHGSLDEYHCFIPGQFEPYTLDDSRFVVIPLSALREHLVRNSYLAFHHLGPTLKTHLIHIRNQDSSNLFPVTTTTHSISYAYMLSRTFAPYCFCPLYRFDAILASSEAVRQTLRCYFQQISSFYARRLNGPEYSYPGRIPVIPLGIDCDALVRGRMTRARARAALGFSDDCCVLLWFGRISAGMKADLLPLLQALLLLRRSAPSHQCVLAIAGAGDDGPGTSLYAGRHRLLESYITAATHDNSIRFFHCPSDKVKSELYSAADIFISLSDNIQESFGLTVLEAQAMGLPVIVSDWDGYKDTVRHGVTGFRVPTYWCRDSGIDRLARHRKIECYHFRQAQSLAVDIPRFLSYLTTLMNDRTLRARLAGQARAHARQYHWRHIIRRYERFWIELYEESADLTARCGIENLRASASRSAGPPERACREHPHPSYHDAFHHFATATVDDTWYVGFGGFSELLIAAAAGNLSQRLLLKILETIEKKGYHGRAIRIRDLMDDLSTRTAGGCGDRRRADEEVMRHIMWLFKQGVVHCFARPDGNRCLADREAALMA